MSTPAYWAKATRALSRRDPTLKTLIASYHGETLTSRGDAFYTLARSIAGQQISVKAADSVWKKIEAALPAVSAEAVLALSDARLRACGLSGQKVLYLRHIATHFVREKERIAAWPQLPDDALLAELTALKGVGRWTAEMMLIFHYQRPDVFPLADLGLMKAIERHYRITGKQEVLALSDAWRPWRTVATWYLWRALDPVPVEY